MTEINEINEEIRCIGCGTVIQTTDKEGMGYTPNSALEKGLESGDVYCQRCFRLRHYNDIQDVAMTDKEFLALLNSIGQTDALIVNVVDIFDFNGSLIPGLHRFVGDNPVLLVGNKVDILPKSLKKPKMIQWMRERAHEVGLRPIDVTLTSAKSKSDIEDLLDLIEEYRDGRDVYVVGVTNVGKSTLINAIINHSAGIKDLITTSQFPGTTLDKIEIPLDDGQFLIDTPGIIHRQQMAHYLGKKDLMLVSPKKEITYVSNDLNIHRTKLETATEFYAKHVGGLLQPPRENEIEEFPELVRFEFSVKEKTDLVFAGLGWVTIPEAGIVAGWAPKGVDVIQRKSLI
jgi:ribosome biogenesis GTPase YqeH